MGTPRKCTCGGGKKPMFVIGELGPSLPVNLKYKNIGPRLSIVDGQGKLISRLGGEDGGGVEVGKFMAPHGLAMDSAGSIYVGEVAYTNWPQSFPGQPMPRPLRSLQKLERVG